MFVYFHSPFLINRLTGLTGETDTANFVKYLPELPMNMRMDTPHRYTFRKIMIQV